MGRGGSTPKKPMGVRRSVAKPKATLMKAMSKVSAAKGQTGKSVVPKLVKFPDHHRFPDFKPNLTPSQIFRLGSFMDQGGYWRPIYSSVAKKAFKNPHKEFPPKWWTGVDEAMLVGEAAKSSTAKGGKVSATASSNRYGVKCGQRLDDWEHKGWIKAQDPYGWVQWYCRFFQGRRSPDDQRQIQRWLNLTGPKGRFKRMLANTVKAKKKRFDDESVSPVVRQVLLHWGYQLSAADCGR